MNIKTHSPYPQNVWERLKYSVWKRTELMEINQHPFGEETYVCIYWFYIYMKFEDCWKKVIHDCAITMC